MAVDDEPPHDLVAPARPHVEEVAPERVAPPPRAGVVERGHGLPQQDAQLHLRVDRHVAVHARQQEVRTHLVVMAQVLICCLH